MVLILLAAEMKIFKSIIKTGYFHLDSQVICSKSLANQIL